MTIPPADSDRDTNIRYFQEVRALYVDINEKLFHNELKCLSMGMSGDFEDAIRNGATMVRVGTAIFRCPVLSHLIAGGFGLWVFWTS